MAGRVALIEQYTRQGNFTQAIELCCQELSEHPDDANTHALLALNLMKARRMAAAEHEAVLALRMEPELVRAHLVYGWVMLARQKYEHATEAFGAAVALAPNEPEAHLGLGRCQEYLGNRQAAKRSYEHARGLDPEDSGPYYRLAWLALDARDLDAAEKAAEKAVELDPEDADNLCVLGNVRYHQWRLEEARDLCLAALRHQANHQAARRLLFWLKARQTPTLAVFWHFSSWLDTKDQIGRIAALVGMFLVYRLILYVLWDLDFKTAAVWLRWIWLSFCVYTWFSPEYFEWLIAREKEQVHLKDDF